MQKMELVFSLHLFHTILLLRPLRAGVAPYDRIIIFGLTVYLDKDLMILVQMLLHAEQKDHMWKMELVFSFHLLHTILL